MSTQLFVAEWHRIPSTPDVPVVDTKRVLVLFGTIAVLAGSRIAYKYILQRRRKARENEVLAAGQRERCARVCDPDLSQAQLLLCVVCIENPKQIILLPCGHVCLCEDCSDRITEQCPICRERIESRVPAFIT
ncbi:mitochondrial E3 ubiquitin protein ligase 1-like [Cydia pomonella]|uniref:mitochondrial E3 ubiquitin protein ligase 1-like n=1 Tax=Cydia pomonella TaxID=82600 RepID=UPI002ADE44AB|nr:mitochondrial E3 ubiquitin protein ligase 1-like [Cydia pomonella]